MIEIQVLAVVAFWLSMFIQAFADGSNKLKLLKWGWICLLIGWIIIVGSLTPAGVIEELYIEIATLNLEGCVFITAFFISSLGSGYFCGRWYQRKKVNEK